MWQLAPQNPRKITCLQSAVCRTHESRKATDRNCMVGDAEALPSETAISGLSLWLCGGVYCHEARSLLFLNFPGCLHLICICNEQEVLQQVVALTVLPGCRNSTRRGCRWSNKGVSRTFFLDVHWLLQGKRNASSAYCNASFPGRNGSMSLLLLQCDEENHFHTKQNMRDAPMTCPSGVWPAHR